MVCGCFFIENKNTYDAFNNKIKAVDTKGKEVSYTYNKDNQVVEKKYGSSSSNGSGKNNTAGNSGGSTQNKVEKSNVKPAYPENEWTYEDVLKVISKEKLVEETTKKINLYGTLAGISFRKVAAICLIATHLVGTILCIPFLISKHSSFHLSEAITSSSIACIFWGIYLIWNYLWMKPTKFEIENGYLEE